ncbi:MAG: AAA family ATPase [Defluviitaleaceae bacterium]|nr:AAA family ATPase [Defluviitaleaceae bacterium]
MIFSIRVMRRIGLEIKYFEYEKAKAVKPEWLWSGFMRLGKVCLITGQGGVGKSTLTYKLIKAITRGEPLPGQDKANVPPSFCIVQNSEDEEEEDTLPQLEYFDADMSKVRTIEAEGIPITLLDPRLEIAVEELGAKLLVLDPYTTYLGETNMYSPQSMRKALNHLQGIAQKHKCAVVLVGHINKNEGAKSSNRHLGSSDIRHALRSVLVVGELDGNAYAIVPEKMSRGRRVKALAFELFGVPEDENLIDLEWIGECDATADELLNGGKSSRDYDDEPMFSRVSKLEEAEKFLRNTLSETPIDKEDVVAAAEAQGIKRETLKRARKSLGVITDPHGNRSWWNLPPS